jgi:hypothetical protein
VKYTPTALLSDNETSLSFDGLSSVSPDGERQTDFGDRLVLFLRRPLQTGKPLSFALAPQATFFLRGEKGARLG